MPCGSCGKKKRGWQNKIMTAKQQQRVVDYKKQQNIPRTSPINIYELPDELLTPLQLRSKQRHLRIEARKKRIARRNARRDRMQKRENDSQK